MRPADSEASIATALEARSEKLFGGRPAIVRAPGRVNLIGEHTDYNEGFVMPAAIDSYTWAAVSAREGRRLHAYSEQLKETIDLSLDDLVGPPRNHWSDFIRGIAAVLQARRMRLTGANLVIDGRVPMGAGLSSSASIEVAIAMALLSVAHTEMPSLELAKACQQAEHEYVGTRCGIMDQFIAVFGRAGHALMLDCRSLDYEALPIPASVRLVICNSMVKHDLAAGEYNRRRSDCETGVKILQKAMPNVRALRDVTWADLEKHKSEMPERVYRRCRHVISENDRVVAASKALRAGNLNHFGELMNDSHRSLRDDYEVSSRELDLLVDIASKHGEVYGSRMTGGGFGGCTITLVQSEAAERFQSAIADSYKKETGITPEVYVSSATQGASAWRH